MQSHLLNEPTYIPNLHRLLPVHSCKGIQEKLFNKSDQNSSNECFSMNITKRHKDITSPSLRHTEAYSGEGEESKCIVVQYKKRNEL